MSRFFLTVGIFLVAVLIPFLLTDKLLKDFEQNTIKFRNEKLQERATNLMAKFERSIEKDEIFKAEALRLRKKFSSSGLDLNTFSRILPSLVKKYTENARFFLYSSDGELQKTFPEKMPEGLNIWQSFGRAVFNPLKAERKDVLKADMLISSKISRLLSVRSFDNILKEPLEVFFHNKRHIIFAVPFAERKKKSLKPLQVKHSAEKKAGFLLVFVPLHNAPFGWELTRACRALTNSEETVGGIWRSNETAIGNEPLSPGFLHGFRESFQNSPELTVSSDRLFLGRFWNKDSDLLLVVSVSSNSEKFKFFMISFMKKCIYVVTILMTLFFMFISLGYVNISLNLSQKFAVAVFLMIAFPLFALAIFAYQYFETEKRNNLARIERNLEACYEQIDDEMTRIYTQFEDFLVKLSARNEFHSASEGKISRLLASLEKSSGLYRYTFLHVYGLTLEHGWESKRENDSFSYLLNAIVIKFLDENKYPVPDKLKNKKIPVEITELAKSGRIVPGQRRVSTQRRLNKVELGTNQFFLFQNFLFEPGKTAKKAFLSLFFDHGIFSQKLIKTLFRKMKTGNIKIYYRMGNRSSLRESEISNILRRVDENRQETRCRINTDEGEFSIIARPLVNLSGSLALVMSSNNSETAINSTVAVLFAFFVLSLLSGGISKDILTKYFLFPLFELKSGLINVESGKFAEMARLSGGDEVSELYDCFNLMIDSLKQKAKMAPFLRKDLVASLRSKGTPRIIQKNVVVMFAGMRKFGEFEKKLSPEKAMLLINRFFALCETATKSFGGDIDKFVGDTAMILFFPSDELSDNSEIGNDEKSDDKIEKGFKMLCRKAVQASIELNKVLCSWQTDARNNGFDIPDFGIGMNFGKVLAGSIGSEKKRLDYTVIGDSVNVAARLEKLAGSIGNPPVLAGESLAAICSDDFQWNEIPITSIRGKSGAVKVYGLNPANIE
ncbi:MAG: adenylate/guanylate cyclase domain-containing protein [Candidatus Riflebacteria bacterium]|nr:adenylate/guanylate cyclase domain-containing protein [Candidatus Riflebacteria bacterium]